jgi:hypothetical protein
VLELALAPVAGSIVASQPAVSPSSSLIGQVLNPLRVCRPPEYVSNCQRRDRLVEIPCPVTSRKYLVRIVWRARPSCGGSANRADLRWRAECLQD